MKVLMIHPGEDLPSSRIRILAAIPHLEHLGVEATARTYPRGLTARRRLLREANAHDVVVVHYKLPSVADGVLWRRLRPPLVFDFDDALPFRRLPRNGSHASRSRRLRFELAGAVADAFACGSAHLAGLVERTAKPVRILPSPVPVDVPQRGDAPPDGPARIGWIGGRGNLESLARLGGTLGTLAERHDLFVSVIADASLELPGCRVEHVPWTLEGQAAALARLDVGVMPLVDTPWNRGKCAYKLLQYMAAGVACVASPVGMNAELIVPEENGLLADGEEEWARALGRLLDDADLRRRLGRAGRATVEGTYDYASVAKRWLEFFESLSEAGASPR
jgi:hypothetical protein